jgi:hypothetical protein
MVMTLLSIKDWFIPWRVLKAADVTPIGVFKTSTVQALNEVIGCEKKFLLVTICSSQMPGKT